MKADTAKTESHQIEAAGPVTVLLKLRSQNSPSWLKNTVRGQCIARLALV
jgi:hypothetical protein